jgi:hypothetical protein
MGSHASPKKVVEVHKPRGACPNVLGVAAAPFTSSHPQMDSAERSESRAPGTWLHVDLPPDTTSVEWFSSYQAAENVFQDVFK